MKRNVALHYILPTDVISSWCWI